MTITIGLPLGLFLLGLILLILGGLWADSQGGGMLSGLFEGLAGIAACLICWAIAAGILIGRWFA